MMELSNEIRREHGDDPALGEALWTLKSLIAPFAPHLAEELHALFGGQRSVFASGWPEPDAAATVVEEIEVPVQVNGKLRGRIKVGVNADREALLAAARADADVQGHLAGKQVVKEIVVPGRMINFVVK